MSQTIQIPVSNSYGLVSYDSGYQLRSTSANLGNGCDGDDTTYARLQIRTGRNVESYIYYNFPQIDIPSYAHSISVTCSVHFYVSNLGGINTMQLQLFNGSTAMGTGTTISGQETTHTVSLDCGTWTISQLQNVKLRYYAKRYDGTGNTSTNRFIDLYGATLTVSYEYDAIQYQIDCTSKDSDVYIGTQSQYSETYQVIEGDNLEVLCLGTIDGDFIFDNDTDITKSPSVELGTVGNGYETRITLSNISADHTIRVYAPCYLKSNNVWTKANKMYVKTGNSWSEIAEIFEKSQGNWEPCGETIYAFLASSAFNKIFRMHI